DNLVAYDHYLQGLEQIQKETREGLIAGITSFNIAIEEDPNFAQPYAYLAISHYFLDLFQVEKKHIEDINTYADKAILLDPDLNESLIGKALYYMQTGQFELAIQFFDKVLARDPNSGWIHNLLSTIYSLHQPNSENYLRHSIRGIQFAVTGKDSNNISLAYLHLSNALAQNGFLPEAEPYLKQSLSYNENNLFSGILSVYVELGQTQDFDRAYQRFQDLLAKDNTSLPVLNEAAKIAFYQRKYEAAWQYYRQLLAIQEQAGLDVYPGEEYKIAYVLQQLGRPMEAKPYLDQYLAFLQQEQSTYRHLGFAVYYASISEKAQAMAALQTFSQQGSYENWLVTYIAHDPLIQSLSDQPEYQATLQRIQDGFQQQHQQVREVLEAEGLL
ncbi:MAG: tetratricopeptide repeat protein, partial [Bacteroidota bacterium]